ncbi:hypothetical protein SAMN05421505_1668, partial [Sinosporangium album]
MLTGREGPVQGVSDTRQEGATHVSMLTGREGPVQGGVTGKPAKPAKKVSMLTGREGPV